MVSKFGSVLSCVAALTLSSVVLAQDAALRLGLSPVSVGAGPLLFFARTIDANGAPPDSRWLNFERLYVVDPEKGPTPQLVWRGEDRNSIPQPLARVGKDLILFEQGHAARLLSLARGVERRLLPTLHDTEFLGVQGDRIYFLARRSDEQGLRRTQSTDKDGRVLIADASAPKDKLFSMRADFDAAPERVGDFEIERVLEVDARGFYAVRAGAQRSLAYFGYDGRVDEILAVPPSWDVSELFMNFSPDRRFLALSILPSDYGAWRERLLLVLEFTSRRTVVVRERVDASPFIGWSNLPRLPLEWLDAKHLWALPNSALLDVEKNAAVGEETAKLLWAHAIEINEERRRRAGSFDLDLGILWYHGESEPIVNVHRDGDVRNPITGGEIGVSECGRWAAFVHPTTKHTCLVDGTNLLVSVLFEGPSRDMKWLAAQPK